MHLGRPDARPVVYAYYDPPETGLFLTARRGAGQGAADRRALGWDPAGRHRRRRPLGFAVFGYAGSQPRPAVVAQGIACPSGPSARPRATRGAGSRPGSRGPGARPRATGRAGSRPGRRGPSARPSATGRADPGPVVRPPRPGTPASSSAAGASISVTMGVPGPAIGSLVTRSTSWVRRSGWRRMRCF